MILLYGCLLGLGALLLVSPRLWPTARRAPGNRLRLAERLRDRMRQAGLRAVSLPTFLAVSAIAGVAAGAIVLVVVPVFALAAAVGLVALALPALVVSWRARTQRRANRAVWPDVVDHLVSAVRSGLPLPDGVALLARSGPASTREAFAGFESDFAASGNFGRCLDRLRERLGDPVADRILETLRMSREVGGSELPSVLRALASHLRQDAAIRGEVEARQSWVMNAARLGVAAPWVVLVLLATRPEAAVAYNTPAGVAMIVGGFVATVLAYRAMVAIARLPEERRWFR